MPKEKSMKDEARDILKQLLPKGATLHYTVHQRSGSNFLVSFHTFRKLGRKESTHDVTLLVNRACGYIWRLKADRLVVSDTEQVIQYLSHVIYGASYVLLSNRIG